MKRATDSLITGFGEAAVFMLFTMALGTVLGMFAATILLVGGFCYIDHRRGMFSPLGLFAGFMGIDQRQLEIAIEEMREMTQL